MGSQRVRHDWDILIHSHTHKDFQVRFTLDLSSLFLCSKNTCTHRPMGESEVHQVTLCFLKPELHSSPCSEALRISALPANQPLSKTFLHDWWTGAQSSVFWLTLNLVSNPRPLVPLFGACSGVPITPGQLVWDLWVEILGFTLSPGQPGLSLEAWCSILPWE